MQRYLTIALARLDLARLTLAYASAGHVPGYLLDRRGEVREVLSSTGTPVGLFGERRPTPGCVYQLEPGDMVLLLTDGIIESGSYEGGQEFGAERALEYVQAHRHDPVDQLARGLCQAAEDFGPGGPIDDDMTVLISKVADRGSTPR